MNSDHRRNFELHPCTLRLPKSHCHLRAATKSKNREREREREEGGSQLPRSMNEIVVSLHNEHRPAKSLLANSRDRATPRIDEFPLLPPSAVVRLVIGAIYNRTRTPTGITIFSSTGGVTAAASPETLDGAGTERLVLYLEDRRVRTRENGISFQRDLLCLLCRRVKRGQIFPKFFLLCRIPNLSAEFPLPSRVNAVKAARKGFVGVDPRGSFAR